MLDGANSELTPRERQLANLRQPWARGQTGNPSGRPQIVRDVAAAAREHTEEAIKTLADALKAKDAPWSSKIKAAEVLLDRGYGCAPQTVNLSGNLATMTYEQLSRALALHFAVIDAERPEPRSGGDIAPALLSPHQTIDGDMV